MKSTLAIRVMLLILLVAGLTAAIGCDSARGGAKICLEGISVGSLSAEGKPIQGLPSGKMDIVLKVSANKVSVSTTDSTTIIKLSPSEATITIGPEGISIAGVESDQMEMKWQTAQ